MPIASPIRLDRLQEGVFTILGDAVSPAQVGWAYGQGAFESMPGDLVNVTMSSGPTQWARKAKRGSILLPFDTITIEVTQAVIDTRNLIRVNGIDYFIDTQVAMTVEDIRDTLVVALNSDPDNDPWTAAAGVPVDELVITPNFLGSVFSLELVGDLVGVSQTISGDAVLVTKGTRVFTLGIESFSKSREPRNGAWNLTSKVLAAFEAEDYIETLAGFGVGVWDKGTATDISAIAGANWESRVAVDVQVAMKSVFVRPVDQIETVEIDLTVLSDENTVIDTETIIVSSP